MSFVKTFFSGMCVGAADIVPGISGGTIAFIIGIYEKLLQSIATIDLTLLFRFRFRQFFSKIAWSFLISFLLGVATSFILLAKGFNYLLHHETHRVYLYAAFMGLVVGSVIFCARLLPRITSKTFLWLLVGSGFACWITGLDMKKSTREVCYDVPLQSQFITDDTSRSTNFDPLKNRILAIPASQIPAMVAKKYLSASDEIYEHETLKPVQAASVVEELKETFIDFWVVLCGMLAVSAMLLPGISGSYLLNILGMYGIALGALVELAGGSFDVASFRIVLSMGLGIALGALCFARVVNYLLARFRDTTISCLTGFMVGALQAVYPFWTYAYQIEPHHVADGPILYVIDPILPNVFTWTFALSCIAFITAVSLVLFLERRKSDAELAKRGSASS